MGVLTQFADISGDDLPSLKVLVLDSIGCAIGALAGGPTGPLRGLTDELGDNPLCSLIGGGRTAPGTRLRCRRMSPS